MTEEIKEQDEQAKWLETVQKAQERLQKECDTLATRWERTGMLKMLSGHAKNVMAVLLENQRLINESSTDSGDMAQFKRISIPLVRRVFDPRSFVAWDMVSVQVLLGPAGIVVLNRPHEKYAEDICAFTKKLKLVFPTPIGLFLESDEVPSSIDIRKPHSLDEEAEATAVISVEICEEFCREIINDLRNNVGTLTATEWRTAEELWTNLEELTATVEQKCGGCPNWILCHPDVAKVLKEGNVFHERDDIFALPMKVKRTGTLERNGKKVKVIEDEHFPRHEILTGYKGEGDVAGYAYVPYVPFTRTPVVLDPDTFTPRVGLITRYGKKLAKEGASFYGRLVINNFPEPEPEKQEEEV
jgi:hypothetical protein